MNYQELAAMFKVLANPARLHILRLLVEGPLCVSDLCDCTRRRQAYISQQLMVLRSAGFVECTKSGWKVCYQLANNWQARFVRSLFSEIYINSTTPKK
ncbi:MAG: metalloregulator ArsR/SmtB family transcription factor [Chloroflexota bacterium]|nr:MAG: hypothetical protein KatS3mg045_1044 [Bellilinea sp.]